MTDADLMPFVAHLVKVAALFKDRLTDDVQELYFEALADLSLEAVLTALRRSVQTCTFMPKPAELRALITGGADVELTIEAAWLQYKHLARAVGAYESPTLSDAALADTIVAIFGSWEAACWTELTPEMWAAKRKEFGRVYRVYLEQRPSGPRALQGFCDRRNLERGLLAAVTGATSLQEGSRKLLPPAVVTNDRALFDEREAQRTVWRENVARAIEAATSKTPVTQ